MAKPDSLSVDRDMLSLWVWRTFWAVLMLVALSASAGVGVGYVAGLYYGEQCDPS